MVLYYKASQSLGPLMSLKKSSWLTTAIFSDLPYQYQFPLMLTIAERVKRLPDFPPFPFRTAYPVLMSC